MAHPFLSLALALLASWSGFEEQKLVAGDGYAHAWFGVDVDVDEGTLVVGTVDNCFYVFERVGSTWLETAKRSGAVDPGRLGFSVAVDGDRIAAGNLSWDIGPLAGAGCVDTYVRDAAGWTLEQRLEPLDPRLGGFVGYSVDVEGDTLLAGAGGDDSGGVGAGAAYVFVRIGSTWIQQAKLLASDPEEGDQFGHRVALSGDTALIGAYAKGPGSFQTGAAYVFVRQGTTWSEQQKLTGSAVSGYAQFGYSVDVEGDRAVVGARLANLVFAFERVDGTWIETQRLRPLDGAGDGDFGRGVVLHGERLLTARLLQDGNLEPGSGYTFRIVGRQWAELGRLTPGDGTVDQLFGDQVALHGETAVVAAMLDDQLGDDAGAVYVFDLPRVTSRTFCSSATRTTCPCDNSGTPGSAEGCANSTGRGGLLVGAGTASVAADDLALGVYNLPSSEPAFLVASAMPLPGTVGVPLGGGLLCIGGTLRRIDSTTTSSFGTAPFGPGLRDRGRWLPGETWGFQVVHRDGQEPCGTGYGVTNAVSVSFHP